MSFKLKELLKFYECNEVNVAGDTRGHGVEVLIAFFVCLGIPDPDTSDLSRNILKAWSACVSGEVPLSVAESYISDCQQFLIFISSHKGWCAEDYTDVLMPANELKNVIHLPFRLGKYSQ
jgi:hypothetical protein